MITGGPKLLECDEDEDFTAAFDKMLSENIQVNRKTNILSINNSSFDSCLFDATVTFSFSYLLNSVCSFRRDLPPWIQFKLVRFKSPACCLLSYSITNISSCDLQF